jgi:hypothetical protein
MRAIFPLIISAVISSPVLAEDRAQRTVSVYMPGNDLTHDCRSFMVWKRTGSATTQQLHEAGLCYGYVTGVFDSVEELTNMRTVDLTAPFCLPKDANANDLTEIVAKFLDENPAKRNHSGFDLVSGAWAASFPCPPR